MNVNKLLFVGAVVFVCACLSIAGIVLMYGNVFAGARHSWWLIATLICVFPVVGRVMAPICRGVSPPSEEAIEHAFDRAYTQKLRSIVFSFPQGWKYRKIGKGVHQLLIEQCAFQAMIVIELAYLDETEINTLDGYLAYAVEFVKGRKSQLLFNRVVKRWGMNVHECADESPRTAGHRVTVPYHGTEYGFQLRLNDVTLAPAARRLFDGFVERIKFEPPILTHQSGFDGRLSIGLPQEFFMTDAPGKDRLVWKSRSREGCAIEVVKCAELHAPMSPALLRPLISRCPRPKQAECELARARPISLSENGFGGHVYYQASDTWGWFAAVGDLPSGGRYIFCLDDRDPRQEPYFGIYHYQQMAYEILVTLAERIK